MKDYYNEIRYIFETRAVDWIAENKVDVLPASDFEERRSDVHEVTTRTEYKI